MGRGAAARPSRRHVDAARREGDEGPRPRRGRGRRDRPRARLPRPPGLRGAEPRGAPPRQALPAGTDPGLLFVVVTASDGYRSLYSGGEILLSRLPENVLLVDTEGGKPLLRRSGRLESYARADFFVDRSVRNLAEVRVLLAP
ncbi:MAG: hypothetical protein IPN03_11270 [Holophagales bacterium]|nr:hypothetical protein [Holophagales bacterium]